VLIYPNDNIPDAIVQQLRMQLAPGYDYIDCHGDGQESAGVFARRKAPGPPASPVVTAPAP